MASMREIRTRIKSVRNIAKITRAMKLVAAARLKRAQGRVQAARPYAEHMERMMKDLGAAGAQISHPLLEVREEQRIAALVLTSDRGLCGSYNTNVLRKAMELLRPRDPETVRLLLMGRKGEQFFRRRPYEVVHAEPLAAGEVNFAQVAPVAAELRRLFEAREVDAVYLVYAKFINAITQEPTILPLLPLKPPEVEEEGSAKRQEAAEVIFEPEPAELLGTLLPRYVDTQIYRALVEAVASEHGARMTSMTAATENATEMIESLTLSLNRARQAAITTEIAEIVTGAQAVEK